MMTNKNFSYSFETSKTSGEVFQLLLQIPQWWSGVYEETITGKSEQLNDEFSFKAGGGVHNTKQKLVELVPNEKIVWLVTASNLTFLSDPGEWKDTRICFDISARNNRTLVTFVHEGLVPGIECYDACSSGWTQYLERLEKKLK
jgi:hypothetical protein